MGITVGDLNGIGMEVIIKSLQRLRSHKHICPIVYGNAKAASFYRKALNAGDFHFNIINKAEEAKTGKPNLLNLDDQEINIQPGKPSPETGAYAVKSLLRATDDLAKGLVDVLVTAPIDKNTAQGKNFPYAGHTEFFTQYAHADDSLMLMISGNRRIGVVTGHIPLKDVSDHLTPEKIMAKLGILHQSLVRDFLIQKPKIAVLGVNPHAGDNGLLGEEENKLVKPVIKEAQNKGWLVYGPYSADGFFGSAEASKFDGVLAMYHDQGLIPFKTLSFGEGVNFTAGLPIVRTSPDHGTGYDIAGKDEAQPESFLHAIYAAYDIFSNRKKLKEWTQDPLQIQNRKKHDRDPGED